jgi:hypothetical protein
MRSTTWILACAGALALAGCGGGGSGGSDLPAVDPLVSYVRSAPGTGGGAWGISAAAFADGSTATVGMFDGMAVFGQGEAGETVLTATAGNDAFVARHAGDGTLQWVRQLRSTGAVAVEEVATLSGGSVAVAGWFVTDATFGAGTAAEVTLTALGGYDGFLAAYSAQGSFQWARRVGGAGGGSQGLAVAATTDGGVAFAGLSTAPSLVLGAGEAEQTTLATTGLEGIVAKYTAAGALVWARATSCTGDAAAWGVASLPGGGVAMLGAYAGAADVGMDGLGSAVVLDSVGGSTDACLVGYNAAGAVTFARTMGGPANDVPRDLASGSNGTIVVAGSYYGEFTAGAESVAPVTLESPGNPEVMFVACYGPTGQFRWLRGTEDMEHGSRALACAVFADGGIAVTGSFGGTLVLGAGDPTATMLTATGDADGFVARYAPDGTFDWVAAVNDTGFGEGCGVAPVADGSVVVTGYYAGACTWGLGGTRETTLTSATAWEYFVARYEADGSF